MFLSFSAKPGSVFYNSGETASNSDPSAAPVGRTITFDALFEDLRTIRLSNGTYPYQGWNRPALTSILCLPPTSEVTRAGASCIRIVNDPNNDEQRLAIQLFLDPIRFDELLRGFHSRCNLTFQIQLTAADTSTEQGNMASIFKEHHFEDFGHIGPQREVHWHNDGTSPLSVSDIAITYELSPSMPIPEEQPPTVDDHDLPLRRVDLLDTRQELQQSISKVFEGLSTMAKSLSTILLWILVVLASGLGLLIYWH